jgi:hypothetical protein
MMYYLQKGEIWGNGSKGGKKLFLINNALVKLREAVREDDRLIGGVGREGGGRGDGFPLL